MCPLLISCLLILLRVSEVITSPLTRVAHHEPSLDLQPLPYPPGYGPSSCTLRPVSGLLEHYNTTELQNEDSTLPPSDSVTAFGDSLVQRRESNYTAGVLPPPHPPPAPPPPPLHCEQISHHRFTIDVRRYVLPPIKMPQRLARLYYLSYSCTSSAIVFSIYARPLTSVDRPESYWIIGGDYSKRRGTVDFHLNKPKWIKVDLLYLYSPRPATCEFALFGLSW